jgi:hypothetical protein
MCPYNNAITSDTGFHMQFYEYRVSNIHVGRPMLRDCLALIVEVSSSNLRQSQWLVFFNDFIINPGMAP